METRDPWYFQRWAREQTLGNATRKLILMSLGATAESQTGYGFALQEDLAVHAECSTRTVSTHLRALEDAGLLIRRKRFSKNGKRLADGFLLLAPGVTTWPEGEPVDPSGGVPDLPEDISGGASPAGMTTGSSTTSPPETQVAGQERPSTAPEGKRTRASERASVRDQARKRLPDDFPPELTDHARIVFRILRQVAREHGAREVYPLAVGRVLAAFPRRPVVQTAHAVAAWSVDSREIKDVVATYRRWLTNERDLAGVERLQSDDLAAVQPGANVTPIRPRGAGGRGGPSAADFIQAGLDLDAAQRGAQA